MSLDIPGYNPRQTAELRRRLKAKLAARFSTEPKTDQLPQWVRDCSTRVVADTKDSLLWQIDRLNTTINEARQWLREGAPGKALEVLDAAKERLK